MKKIFLLLLLLPFNTQAQFITTVAGGGTSGLGDGGAATAAAIPNPECVAFDRIGNLYISDLGSSRIRKVDTFGIITTVAGPGVSTTIGDGGAATAAYLKNPMGVTCDTFGNVYIADRNNYRIRKITVSTGIITTIAGNGTNIFAGSGDGGPATAAQFNTANDVIFDKRGNLYIADNSAHAIRKVNAAGIISTFAGIGGSPGYSGDGGPATAAELKDPRNLAFDDTGNLYIAEQLGGHVRKVDTFGIIHTIAGAGGFAFNGDSIPARSANLRMSGIVYLNHALYVSTIYHRIRKIDFTNDTIYTVAGTGTGAYNGDSIAAVTAQLYNPEGLAVNACGNLFLADLGNERVRKITLQTDCFVPDTSKVGVTEPLNVNFTVYPNPARREITVTARQALGSIAITNLLGEMVYTTIANKPEVHIDIADRAPGMYFIKVDGAGVTKFWKE